MMYCTLKLVLARSLALHNTTPIMAMAKLTQRRLFIFSFRKTTANNADTIGKVRLIIAPLLAVDCCVPIVINTCAGNCPSSASIKNILRSASFLFLFFFISLYTKGSIKIVASNIGMNTVLKAPTCSCTSLIEVNCKDHIRLQANNAPQDNKDFFMQFYCGLFY